MLKLHFRWQAPSSAPLRIPKTRIGEQQRAKQSSAQRWKKDELRKCGLWRYPNYLQYFVSTLWGCHHLQTLKKPSVHSQFSPLSFSNKIGRIYSKCAQKWYDFRKALKYLHHLHRVSAVPRNLTSPPPADAAIPERDRTGGLGRRCLGGLLGGSGGAGGPDGRPGAPGRAQSTGGRAGWTGKKTFSHVTSSSRSCLSDPWMGFRLRKAAIGGSALDFKMQKITGKNI